MSVTSGSSFVILNSTARGKGNGTASERPQDRKSSRCSPEASVAGTEQENTAAADAGNCYKITLETCEQRDIHDPPCVPLPPAAVLGTD